MLFLGIESSCDETAAAVVRDGWEVLSNEIASQAEQHAETGGVVPEVAARAHVGVILPVIDRALSTANVEMKDVDAIAVANGPGLAGSLLSGVVTANTLAAFTGKPLVGTHHILGHIRANWLERDAAEINYPIVTLTVSGGHNELVLIRDEHALPEPLGETQDDAAGEAFDKVARLLGLGYPGGPAIEKVAKGSAGVPELPRAWMLPKDISRNFSSSEAGERLRDGRLTLTNFDFSFSGLKSEVRRRVQTGDFHTAALAHEFQKAVVDVLATKLILAAQQFDAAEIHLAGGVSANLCLRERVAELASELPVRFPVKMSYCTDNAAMIAGAGYFLFQKDPAKYETGELLDAEPNLRF